MSVLDAVFDRVDCNSTRRRSLLLSWGLAIAAHSSLWLAANQAEPSLETWSARIAFLVHQELTQNTPLELDESPPPAPIEPAPPPPAVEPEPSVVEPATAISRLRTPPAAATPERAGDLAPPAQAGTIVAQEANPSAPVDLTGDVFVTGSASAYAGGATTRGGTNPVAVSPEHVDRAAAPTANPGTADNSQPVQLPQSEWRCPWPGAALAEEIYEQSVLLRVVVRADGSVESVRIIEDPGYGFGPAALACAERTRFSPARDSQGRSIRATSPPIRVRFTR